MLIDWMKENNWITSFLIGATAGAATGLGLSYGGISLVTLTIGALTTAGVTGLLIGSGVGIIIMLAAALWLVSNKGDGWYEVSDTGLNINMKDAKNNTTIKFGETMTLDIDNNMSISVSISETQETDIGQIRRSEQPPPPYRR